MGALSLQNRTIGLIENGTWGPVSAKQMQQLFSEMKQNERPGACRYRKILCQRKIPLPPYAPSKTAFWRLVRDDARKNSAGFFCPCCLPFSLSGCGSDSALTDYTSQMNTFYDAFSSGTLALEQIDPSSETAQEELLSGLMN